PRRLAGGALTVPLAMSTLCMTPSLPERLHGSARRHRRRHHAARSEYKIVLATMPLPASPMDTYTAFERPGTVTLRTRIEYAGDVAGQAVRPWSLRQCFANPRLRAVPSTRESDPASTRTPSSGV